MTRCVGGGGVMTRFGGEGLSTVATRLARVICVVYLNNSQV